MTRIRKDLEILGFEVVETTSLISTESYDFHKKCLPQVKRTVRITGCITEETLAKDTDHKLICDRCGQEIK